MADVPLPEPAYTLPFPDDDELAFSAHQMQAYAAAVSAAKDAEIAQLREYLDTAQRRASALGDEVAGLRAEVARLTKIIGDAWGEA